MMRYNPWLRGFLAAALAWGAMIPLAPVRAQAREQQYADAQVYYQVTYKNGKIENLPDVPKTNEGILMVMRFARYGSDHPSYQTVSTGNTGMELLNPARVVETQLKWDGQAWVAALQPRKETPDVMNPRKAARNTRGMALYIQQLLRMAHANEEKLRAARNKLDTLDPDDDEAETVAELKLALSDISRNQREIYMLLMRLQSSMGDQLGSTLRDVPEVGRVENVTGKQLDGRQVIGNDETVKDTGIPAHRCQVWALPPAEGEGERKLNVAMAHPEAGPASGFYYVAYADTDNDGRPDKLIARSPFAQADRPGGWTKWSFKTDHQRVYVGNAWDRPDTRVYSTTPDCVGEDGYDPNKPTLSTDVWFSGYVGGEDGFCGGKYWPYLSNIRVHEERPNPDYDTGPRVIIRETE